MLQYLHAATALRPKHPNNPRLAGCCCCGCCRTGDVTPNSDVPLTATLPTVRLWHIGWQSWKPAQIQPLADPTHLAHAWPHAGAFRALELVGLCTVVTICAKTSVNTSAGLLSSQQSPHNHNSQRKDSNTSNSALCISGPNITPDRGNAHWTQQCCTNTWV